MRVSSFSLLAVIGWAFPPPSRFALSFTSRKRTVHSACFTASVLQLDKSKFSNQLESILQMKTRRHSKLIATQGLDGNTQQQLLPEQESQTTKKDDNILLKKLRGSTVKKVGNPPLKQQMQPKKKGRKSESSMKTTVSQPDNKKQGEGGSSGDGGVLLLDLTQEAAGAAGAVSAAAGAAGAAAAPAAVVRGTVVRRPSRAVRSPYVADVRLDGAPEGEEVLAHAPMLNCAGTVVPGAPVALTPARRGGGGKCSHVIQLAYEQRLRAGVAGNGAAAGDVEWEPIGSHPALAERLARELLARGLLPELAGAELAGAQATWGNSRVDFVLRRPASAAARAEGIEEETVLVEVKNVVCAAYGGGARVPAGRARDGVYLAHDSGGGGEEGRGEEAESAADRAGQRQALFPHGKKKPGVQVVSDRAIKHIHELINLHNTTYTTDTGKNNKISTAILFVVNRKDCQSFRPCHESDLLFAKMLRRAENSGVQVIAYDIVWKNECQAYLGKKLPVSFCCENTTPIIFDEEGEDDKAWLERVLKYNKENGTPNKKKAANEQGGKKKKKGKSLPM